MRNWVKILFFFSFCFFKKTEAQNLVPNNDFENFVECRDTSTLQFHLLLDSTWHQFGSAEYFHSCDGTNYFGVPQNVIGFQLGFSGNGYAGFYGFYNNVFTREYIEIKLLDSLLTGQTYFVQFHLSLADSMRYAIENIGALFTDTLFDPFPAPSYAWQTGIPQIENNQGNMLYDKLNWITISDSFTAIGGEKYMTIGNFKNDAQTIRQNLGGTIPNTQGAFYYIDDVYVGVTPPLSINENKKEEDFVKLYPNPSDGNMILECKLASNETGEMIIYTLTGNIMKRVAVNSGSKTLDVSELKAGMYLYEVRINEKAVEKNKLTIIK